MRPYPGRQSSGNEHITNFNYRLSRARHVVENTFGILTQKFRIFLRLSSRLLKTRTTFLRLHVYYIIL